MWTWFPFDAPSLSYKLNPMLCCKNTNHSCSFYYHRHLSYQRLKRKWWPFTGQGFSRRRLCLVSALNMECILSVLLTLLYRFRNNRMVRVSAPQRAQFCLLREVLGRSPKGRIVGLDAEKTGEIISSECLQFCTQVNEKLSQKNAVLPNPSKLLFCSFLSLCCRGQSEQDTLPFIP